MKPAWPRYVLFADATPPHGEAGGWRFVLSAVDSQHAVAAEDSEPGLRRDRLELMAVVRGLEALDQPSRVTVVSPSRYVRRGFARGLKVWQAEGWKWERFGRRVPVRDHDLWRRIDRALQFHQIECRPLRVDSPASTTPAAAADADTTATLLACSGGPEPIVDPLNQPAVMVLRTPRQTRRGVIRFDAEPRSTRQATVVAAAS